MRDVIRRSVLVVSLLAAPAFAQDVPKQSEPSEIIVEGKRPSNEQLQEFIQSLTKASPRGQLSRFEWEVCPVVIGLSDAQEVAVKERIRRVAESVEIPLGGKKCKPNVLVAVTRDRPGFIDQLSKKLPMLFSDLSSNRRLEIVQEPKATAWHVQGPPLNADGEPLKIGRYQFFDQRSMSMMRSTDEVYFDESTRAGSRITASGRRHFSAAVVVVDADALGGLTTTQLADYAAMRAFARARPTELSEAGVETILKALDIPAGGEIPITLTRWDFGFLRGLYSSSASLYANAQRSEIREILEDELTAKE